MVKLKIRSEITKNIRFVGYFFFVLFAVISFRAYSLQVLQSPQLCRRLEMQHKKTVPLAPKRGTIYDRNGAELAASIEVESLFARPFLVKHKKDAADKLAPIVGIPGAKILSLFKSEKTFIWIRRKLSPLQVDKVKRLNIAGIGFTKESQRFYPNKELASHILGFVGIDSQGLEGLERRYDKLLKGKAGYLLVEKDALGRDLLPEGIKTVDAVSGYDLVLTVDKNIQYIVEKELKKAVKKSKARGGMAIVMDPWTGEVLALAVFPFYNPNRISSFTPEVWRNRAITDVFEPGSTFKPFLVASAFEEGMLSPHDIYFCENGSYVLGGKTIRDTHPYGWLSVKKILKYSSNIGATKIGKHLGKERFYQYIRKFGFGEETGIEFPGEGSGFVPLPYRWPEFTQGTIAFGQGISVSAIQLVTAYCAIANGGNLMRPFLVKRILNEKGVLVQETLPVIRHRVISKKNAHILTEMLKSVVCSGGTGEKAAVKGFEVAGKTGTAQKIDTITKKYSPKKRIASFVGFVPADDPKVTILVVIDEPRGSVYGGVVAAPAFSKIAHQILSNMHVYPRPAFEHSAGGWLETKNEPNTLEHRG